jgi:acyl transferase domain-containing protein
MSNAPPIAIIGIGCRFPGASTPEEFWELLVRGPTRIGPASGDRGAHIVPRHVDTRGELARSAYLDEIETFDCAYFDVSPREAEAMDPQQRLALVVAAHAIEDAGLDRRTLAERGTGVFAAASAHDRSVLVWAPPASPGRFDVHGTASALIANRVSYWLKSDRASLTVDTACSSSLVALDLARRSLLAGECEFAICVSASIMLLDDVTSGMCGAGIVSKSGTCRPYGRGSDGVIRGEGAGAVLLCRQPEALRRGYRIRSQVLGTAIGHNGASNGLSAPNPGAQSKVIRAAHAEAATDPSTCVYVEGNGACWELADALELRSLADCIGAGRPTDEPLMIGSLKGHIGHLESASGMAAVIKCSLILEHDEVPPTLGVDEPLAQLTRDGSRVILANTHRPLRRHSSTVIGASSFAFGGANAHAVFGPAPFAVGASPSQVERDPGHCGHLMTLSAFSPSSLRLLSEATARFLRGDAGDLADACYTSNLARTHGPMRAAAFGDSRAALITQLEQVAASLEAPNRRTSLALFLEPFASTDDRWLRDHVRAYTRVRSRAASLFGVESKQLDAVACDEFALAVAWPAIFALAIGDLLSPTTPLRLGGSAAYAIAVVSGVFGVEDARGLHRLAAESRDHDTTVRFESLVRRLLATPSKAHGPRIRPVLGMTTPSFWIDHANGGASVRPDADRQSMASELQILIGSPRSGSTRLAPTPLMRHLSDAYVAGFDVDWHTLHQDSRCRRVPLPVTPFERSTLNSTTLRGATRAVHDEESAMLHDQLDRLLARHGF